MTNPHSGTLGWGMPSACYHTVMGFGGFTVIHLPPTWPSHYSWIRPVIVTYGVLRCDRWCFKVWQMVFKVYCCLLMQSVLTFSDWDVWVHAVDKQHPCCALTMKPAAHNHDDSSCPDFQACQALAKGKDASWSILNAEFWGTVPKIHFKLDTLNPELLSIPQTGIYWHLTDESIRCRVINWINCTVLLTSLNMKVWLL